MRDESDELRPLRGSQDYSHLGIKPPAFPTEGTAPGDDAKPECVRRTQPEPEAVKPLGENEIGDRLAELRDIRTRADKGGLEAMLQTAKLLRLWSDVTGRRGKAYEEYAEFHANVKKKDAHTLANLAPLVDDIMAYYETEARHNPRFDWPSWRQAARKFLKKKPEEPTDDATEPDQPDEKPDPLAVLTKERDNLTAQVKAATQQYRNERAKREEIEERLAEYEKREHGSEYELWCLIYRSPEPDDPEPAAESDPDPDPEPDDPASVLTAKEAIDLIYARPENETCESIRAVIERIDLRLWDDEDFRELAEQLEGVRILNLDDDRLDMIQMFYHHEPCPIVFCSNDHVLIYENNGLRILNWPAAMARIEPQVAQTREERDKRRRVDDGTAIMRTRLPPKRKLKAMIALIDRLIELKPTIQPKGLQAIEFIRATKQDDERFSDCPTFSDYLHKAVELTEAPERVPPPPAQPVLKPHNVAPFVTPAAQAEPEPDQMGAPDVKPQTVGDPVEPTQEQVKRAAWIDQPLPPPNEMNIFNAPGFRGKPSPDDASLANLRAFIIDAVEWAGLDATKLKLKPKNFWRHYRNIDKTPREIWGAR